MTVSLAYFWNTNITLDNWIWDSWVHAMLFCLLDIYLDQRESRQHKMNCESFCKETLKENPYSGKTAVIVWNLRASFFKTLLTWTISFWKVLLNLPHQKKETHTSFKILYFSKGGFSGCNHLNLSIFPKTAFLVN